MSRPQRPCQQGLVGAPSVGGSPSCLEVHTYQCCGCEIWKGVSLNTAGAVRADVGFVRGDRPNRGIATIKEQFSPDVK